MEAGLREEQPTPPPADSPQRHNSALSNAGCSSGAGASHVLWCANCQRTGPVPAAFAGGAINALLYHRVFACPVFDQPTQAWFDAMRRDTSNVVRI